MRKVIIVIAAAALALSACNPFESANLAEDAVDAFHQRYNYRLYSEIYLESDEAMRRETEYRELYQALRNLELGLGQVVSTERRDITFRKSPSGGPDTAYIVMQTEFEFGAAEETFAFTFGREVKMVSYGYEVNRTDTAARWDARGPAPIAKPPVPAPGGRRAQPLTPEEIEQLPPEIQRVLRDAGAI